MLPSTCTQRKEKKKSQCTRSLAQGRLSDLEGCLLNRTWSQVAKIANIPNARLGVGNAACWEWQPGANQNLDICASGWDPWLFGSAPFPGGLCILVRAGFWKLAAQSNSSWSRTHPWCDDQWAGLSCEARMHPATRQPTLKLCRPQDLSFLACLKETYLVFINS